MITNSFSVFQPFSDRLRVALFTKEDAAIAKNEIARKLGAQGIASVEQVHGNVTIITRTPDARIAGADGLVTDQQGLELFIRMADCQNFVIYEPERNIVGLLHAGWRGVIRGAIPEFFRVLKKEWGALPEETIVAAGPSLCTTCAEFSDPRKELPLMDSSFIHGRCVDLRGAADAQFRSLGVLPDRMERHPDCTRCHPEKYWSYRGGDREAVARGRNNALACMLM